MTNYYHDSSTCGTGKSYTLFNTIAKETTPTIIVSGRINILDEHAPILKNDAFIIHSKNDDTIDVHEKIENAINRIESKETNNHVIMITHNAFLQYSKWDKLKSGWSLVIDETIEFFRVRTLDTQLSAKTSVFWDLFEVDLIDGVYDDQYSKIKFSQDSKKPDVLTQSNPIVDLMRLSNTSFMIVSSKYWRQENVKKIDVFVSLDVHIFDNFSNVIFLADGFNKSPIYEYLISWCKKEIEPLNQQLSRTIKNLNERVKIIQLTGTNPSLYLFDKLTDSDFHNLSDAINEKSADNKMIWTINKDIVKDCIKINGDYLTPKQSGTNKYVDSTCVCWLAAMKTCNQICQISNQFGINRDMMDEMKELEPMYQFVMRSALRDPKSTKPVTAIVFGPQQAIYLANRFKISPKKIEKLGISLDTKPKKFKDRQERNFYYNTISKIKKGKPIRKGTRKRLDELFDRWKNIG